MCVECFLKDSQLEMRLPERKRNGAKHKTLRNKEKKTVSGHYFCVVGTYLVSHLSEKECETRLCHS